MHCAETIVFGDVSKLPPPTLQLTNEVVPPYLVTHSEHPSVINFKQTLNLQNLEFLEKKTSNYPTFQIIFSLNIYCAQYEEISFLKWK